MRLKINALLNDGNGLVLIRLTEQKFDAQCGALPRDHDAVGVPEPTRQAWYVGRIDRGLDFVLNRFVLITLGLGLLLGTRAATAATPTGFTATYNVLQDDEPIGVATVTLRSGGNGEWVYRKDMKGTGGLAAMLGADVTETSRFRWKGNVPEAISYDYRLVASIKNKQRHMKVDWATDQVTVDEGKGPQTYPASPGMVERNTTPLALGLALRDGRQQVALPVAVRQNVQTQNFRITGHGPVKVMGIEAGVNITVGLPVVRTSVDHGTAFDIAGTGQADERSLLEALRQAIALAPAPQEAA